MNNWLNKARLINVYHFLGPKVVWLVLLSSLTGIGLFAAEFAFAFAMQVFLNALGVTKDAIRAGPEWFRGIQLEGSLLLVSSLVILRSCLQWLQTYVQNSAGYRFGHKLRSRILDWIYKAEYVNTAEVINYYGERTSAAGQALLYLQIAISQIFIILFLGVSLLIMLPKQTLIAGLILATLYFPLKKFAKMTEASGMGVNKLFRVEMSRLLINLQNLLFLKIYSLEDTECKKQQTTLDEILRQHLRYMNISGFSQVLPNIIGIAVISGIVLVLHNSVAEMSGILIAYFYLFFRFLQTTALLSQNYSNFVFHLPSIEELGRWWAAHSLDSPRVASTLVKVEEKPLTAVFPIGWQLRNISFAYPGRQEKIFDRFNLEIKPGEAFVVIGPSGAGKSTLVALLLDQIQPQEGTIHLIDKDAQAFNLRHVRREFLSKVGYVGPEPFLFNGTIKENLSYGLDYTPTAQDITDAVKQAECQFIYELKEQFEHRITDQGQGLSAGQKQRLSLARAILRRPATLVLDEATANLDFKTEKALIKTLEGLKGRITLVIVTHRDSLLVLSDHTLEL